MARCIAVLGAANVGKSTLVDRLCSLEGEAPKPASSGEIRVARFQYLDEQWGAIDCPGSLEFMQDSIDALMIADAAVIVVSPEPEQAVLAAPYLRVATDAGLPSFVFINRMDEAQARMSDIVSGLQTYVDHPLVLRQIPIRQDGAIVGAVDLVSERAWKYRQGEPSALIEIPDDLIDREQEARGELLESLSEFDDWLLEEIIEDRAPADGPVYAICARALQDNQATPAFIGSASHGNGVVRMMKALRHEAPTVAATRDRLGESVAAASFYARHRKHVGKTVYLRVFDDGLKTAAPLGGGSIGMITDPSQDKPSAMAEIEAGDLVAAVKSDHLMRGNVYTRNGVAPAPGWRKALSPLTSRVVTPTNDRDEAKLSEALAKVAQDDPSIQLGHDAESGAHVISAQGALHLRLVREILTEVFGIETEERSVTGAFRETITRKIEKRYRHKKQSGGAGQFADVVLVVEPAKRGKGFSFTETVKGGAVPRQFIPAVEHGARESLARGPLGFPVVDVAVTLIDGLHHAVDSSDMAFRIAGRSGVQEALAEAAPVLLEPFYLVTFSAPSAFTGALVAIVSSQRGQVQGYDRDPDAAGWDLFRALMPAEALGGLIADLRSATQGVGRFEAVFDHYQELYGRDAEKIVQARAEEGGRR